MNHLYNITRIIRRIQNGWRNPQVTGNDCFLRDSISPKLVIWILVKENDV